MGEPVVIWGSGAIGGTIGAYLARAGDDVLFVDTVADHLRAISEGRLRIEGPIDTFAAGGRSCLPDAMHGQHKLILLAVKAHHTEAATRALAPFLAADGAVVSCQNGLNEPVIANIVGRERTIGCFVNFGADYLEPGRITYGIRGAVVVGELDGQSTPRIRMLHDMLRRFEPAAVISDDIFAYLWGKMAYGAVLKYTALSNATIADCLADARRRPVIVALIQEVLRVAEAEGILARGFDGFEPSAFLRNDSAAIAASLDVLAAYNRDSGKPHSGIWRDLVVRKRPTEVKAQGAPLQAAARRHGIETPHYDMLVQLIQAVETGERIVSDALIDEMGKNIFG